MNFLNFSSFYFEKLSGNFSLRCVLLLQLLFYLEKKIFFFLLIPEVQAEKEIYVCYCYKMKIGKFFSVFLRKQKCYLDCENFFKGFYGFKLHSDQRFYRIFLIASKIKQNVLACNQETLQRSKNPRWAQSKKILASF